jgi:hypothetical protein
VQLDTEDQTDSKQAAGDDRGGRGFHSKGVQGEFLDVVWQLLAFPEDAPGTVEEDVSHPRVMRNGKRKVLPAQAAQGEARPRPARESHTELPASQCVKHPPQVSAHNHLRVKIPSHERPALHQKKKKKKALPAHRVEITKDPIEGAEI